MDLPKLYTSKAIINFAFITTNFFIATLPFIAEDNCFPHINESSYQQAVQDSSVLFSSTNEDEPIMIINALIAPFFIEEAV
jgi:hypothetical protein